MEEIIDRIREYEAYQFDINEINEFDSRFNITEDALYYSPHNNLYLYNDSMFIMDYEDYCYEKFVDIKNLVIHNFQKKSLAPLKRFSHLCDLHIDGSGTIESLEWVPLLKSLYLQNITYEASNFPPQIISIELKSCSILKPISFVLAELSKLIILHCDIILGHFDTPKLDHLEFYNKEEYTHVSPDGLCISANFYKNPPSWIKNMNCHIVDPEFTQLDISNLTRLESLKLNHFPRGIETCIALKTIHIECNTIPQFDISNLLDLRTVYLNGRYSNHIPINTEKCTKLTKLATAGKIERIGFEHSNIIERRIYKHSRFHPPAYQFEFNNYFKSIWDSREKPQIIYEWAPIYHHKISTNTRTAINCLLTFTF